MTTRIRMTEGHDEEYPSGHVRRFRAGRFYNLDDDDAEPLIEAEKAYDENEPPSCAFCGQAFTVDDLAEGEYDAYRARDGHVDAEHGDEVEVDATDAARERADEAGIDLSEIEGTGQGGRIVVSDVDAAAEE